MSYGVRLVVWGDFAAFNRPEMKVERVSYDVMTPSAARGVLEAIYWKPEMRWIVDEIRVLNPIVFTHVRRNEIDCKIPSKRPRGPLGIDTTAHRQQRSARVLRDVRYGIRAHVEVVQSTGADGAVIKAPEGKHLDMFKRRARRGQYFHHPYLGCREFPAHFELVEDFPACPEGLKGRREFGLMLHDIAFVPDKQGKVLESHQGTRLRAEPRFFQAVMVDGVIQVPPLDMPAEA